MSSNCREVSGPLFAGCVRVTLVVGVDRDVTAQDGWAPSVCAEEGTPRTSYKGGELKAAMVEGLIGGGGSVGLWRRGGRSLITSNRVVCAHIAQVHPPISTQTPRQHFQRHSQPFISITSRLNHVLRVAELEL